MGDLKEVVVLTSWSHLELGGQSRRLELKEVVVLTPWSHLELGGQGGRLEGGGGLDTMVSP